MGANEIESRRPVWEALSELFLDTELDETDFQRIAMCLAESPYGIGELEDILRFEVLPKLKWNLMCVAGEWAGFDRDWLVETLTPMIGRKGRFQWPSLVAWMIRDDRNRIFDILRQKRKTEGSIKQIGELGV